MPNAIDNVIRTTLNFHCLPTDLIRYQLLPFCNLQSGVKLARASHVFFSALRHNIYRSESVRHDRFMKQSREQSKHIGICSAVFVTHEYDLTRLLEHIAFRPLSHPLLHLEIEFKDTIGTVVLPEHLHTLIFGQAFNQSISRVTFPTSLHTLAFGHHFDQSFDDVILPANLHTLSFGYNFNHTLARVTLPIGLRNLIFGHNFDCSLHDVTLPSQLRTLAFGARFNKPLDNVSLPASLYILTFGFHFNQSLDGITFPTSLHTLEFTFHFKISIAGITFPDSLRSLIFGPCFGEKFQTRLLANLSFPPQLRIFKRRHGYRMFELIQLNEN